MRTRDPGGSVTVFEIIELLLAIGLGALGWVACRRWGWVPGSVAAGLGLLLGHRIGSAFGDRSVLRLVRQLETCSTLELKTRLSDEACLGHLIVPILLKRGEPAKELQGLALSQLLADAEHVRWHGWRTLCLWFPEAARDLQGLDVKRDPSEYRERVDALR